MKTAIYWIEGNWLGRLAIVTRPRGNDWLEDEITYLQQGGFDVIVSLLTQDEVEEFGLNQEKNVAEAYGLKFISLPIEDRSIPSSKWPALELIEKLNRYLIEGKSVAIHCRQSIGRSSLIAVGLLVASGLKPEIAIENVSEARGCDVPETKEQRDWLMSVALELSTLTTPTHN